MVLSMSLKITVFRRQHEWCGGWWVTWDISNYRIRDRIRAPVVPQQSATAYMPVPPYRYAKYRTDTLVWCKLSVYVPGVRWRERRPFSGHVAGADANLDLAVGQNVGGHGVRGGRGRARQQRRHGGHEDDDGGGGRCDPLHDPRRRRRRHGDDVTAVHAIRSGDGRGHFAGPHRRRRLYGGPAVRRDLHALEYHRGGVDSTEARADTGKTRGGVPPVPVSARERFCDLCVSEDDGYPSGWDTAVKGAWWRRPRDDALRRSRQRRRRRRAHRYDMTRAAVVRADTRACSEWRWRVSWLVAAAVRARTRDRRHSWCHSFGGGPEDVVSARLPPPRTTTARTIP